MDPPRALYLPHAGRLQGLAPLARLARALVHIQPGVAVREVPQLVGLPDRRHRSVRTVFHAQLGELGVPVALGALDGHRVAHVAPAVVFVRPVAQRTVALAARGVVAAP